MKKGDFVTIKEPCGTRNYPRKIEYIIAKTGFIKLSGLNEKTAGLFVKSELKLVRSINKKQ